MAQSMLDHPWANRSNCYMGNERSTYRLSKRAGPNFQITLKVWSSVLCQVRGWAGVALLKIQADIVSRSASSNHYICVKHLNA